MSWSEDEFATLDLGDERRNQRAIRVADQLGGAPHESIPKACGGWAESKAAYRLFDNPEVTAERLLAPHVEKTHERMNGRPVVLCIADTTEVKFTYRSAATGLGPLAHASERGFLLHPILAVTPERLCLGVLDAQWLVRDAKTHGTSLATKKTRPLAEKESQRWLESFDRLCLQAETVPETRLVFVADREGDIYEVLERAEKSPIDVLIRCCQKSRALMDGGELLASTAVGPSLGMIEVSVPRNGAQPARTARLTLKSARLRLRPPQRPDKKLAPIEITVIRALEEHPPSGTEALDWTLLTNRSAETLEEAITLVRWYVCRWQIEVYFRVLKVGCKIESLQLGDFSRLQTAIAIYLIVAWRIQFLITLGRESPDMPCDALFDLQEWQAAWIVVQRTAPPKKPPKLQEMIRIIAGLGGFLARTGDGEPGAETFWTGLDKVRNFAEALAAQAEIDALRKRRK